MNPIGAAVSEICPSWAFFITLLTFCWQSGNFRSQFRVTFVHPCMLSNVGVESPPKRQRLAIPLTRIRLVVTGQSSPFSTKNFKSSNFYRAFWPSAFHQIVSIEPPSGRPCKKHLNELDRSTGFRGEQNPS